MEVLLSSFKKDRQGAVTSIAELKLPPRLGNLAAPAVSTSLFSSDQLAAINHYATESSRQAYDAMIEYVKASKNTPHEYTGNVGSTTTTENPSPVLPISSAMPQNMPMNPYYSQNGQIITAPICPNPIRSVPYSAILPNQVTRPLDTVTAPNFNSVPTARVNPMGNTAIVPASLP